MDQEKENSMQTHNNVQRWRENHQTSSFLFYSILYSLLPKSLVSTSHKSIRFYIFLSTIISLLYTITIALFHPFFFKH
jgi:hypothetical protein